MTGVTLGCRNECLVTVLVVLWLQLSLTYPAADAVNCHVPGFPVIVTYPELFVVLLKLAPLPSLPVTDAPEITGPLVLPL